MESMMMKALRMFALLAAAVAIFTFPAGATPIDDFSTGGFSDCVGNNPGIGGCVDASDDFANPAASALGGNRHILASYTGPVAPVGHVLYGVDPFTGVKFLNSSLHGSATVGVIYDGGGGGLGGGAGVDVTSGLPGLIVRYAGDHPSALSLFACEDAAFVNCASTSTIPLGASSAFVNLFVPFSAFSVVSGAGESLLATNYFGFFIFGSPNLDFNLKFIEPSDEPGIVPEPGSLLMASAGLVAVAFFRRRRK